MPRRSFNTVRPHLTNQLVWRLGLVVLLATLGLSRPTAAQGGAGPVDFAASTIYQASALTFNTDLSDVLAIADLNGDNLQDLVVGNFDADSVSILLGRRDGSGGYFGVPTTTLVATDDRIHAAIVDDFVDGGAPEIAVLNGNYTSSGAESTSVTLLGSNVDGGYAVLPGKRYPISPDVYGSVIAGGDFNDDGRPDAVVGTENGLITVLPGNGSGFGSATAYLLGNAGSGFPAYASALWWPT